MSFLYITLFYIGTMNTMRQYLAVAILFFATRYLEKRKYLVFVAALVLASTIHTTALMGIAYLFVYVWLNAERRQRLYLAIAAVLIVPGIAAALVYYESGHISNYFSGTIENVNITFAYQVIVFAIACLLMRASDNRLSTLYENQRAEKEIAPSTLIYFLGLVASSAGLFFAYLSRLGYYFVVFGMVFWGRAVKRKEWGWLFWLMSIVYALYTFAHELAYNGSGIFPFRFFFC